MTNEDLNHRAHEAMGRGCWHERQMPQSSMCRKCHHSFDENPNYCGDLNLAFEFQAWTLSKRATAFVLHLIKIIGGDVAQNFRSKYFSIGAVRGLAAATAEQRVRACLAALGLDE